MQLEEYKSTSSERIAAFIAKALSPPLVGVAVLGVIAYAATSSWREFLLWWGLTAGAISVAPLAFVLWGVRRGAFSDYNVTPREQRKWPFLIGLSTTGAAIATMLMLGAPRVILEVTIVSMAGGLILFGLTQLTKPSMHTATIAGSAVVLGMQFGFGPHTLPLLALVPLVGWGRVKIHAHTLYHVILGAVTGGLVAAILFGFIKQIS